jgi:hypothetical protein
VPSTKHSAEIRRNECESWTNADGMQTDLAYGVAFRVAYGVDRSQSQSKIAFPVTKRASTSTTLDVDGNRDRS